LLVQERRIRHLEDRVAEFSLPTVLAALPPNGRSPLDLDPVDAAPSTITGAISQEEPDKSAVSESNGLPSSKPASKGIAVPSRVLPTPSGPIGVPREDRIRALDDQIDALIRERDRLRRGDAAAGPSR